VITWLIDNIPRGKITIHAKEVISCYYISFVLNSLSFPSSHPDFPFDARIDLLHQLCKEGQEERDEKDIEKGFFPLYL